MGISLRLILILFAIFVVAIIAFDGWRRNGQRKVVITARGGQDSLADDDSDPRIDFTPMPTEMRAEPVFAIEPQVVQPLPEKIKVEAKQAVEPPVIVLHLMTKNIPFQGPNLLQGLLSTGLRYGDMSIFHRFTSPSGQGTLQFSVASAVKPGIFNLDDLESFTTPGITLFFAADQVESPMASYDLLLEVVRKLEDRLGGNILDESRKPLTADAINRHREVLMKYESSCQLYG